MDYAPEFFDLQLRFGLRAAELAGLPLPDALLAYTNLYVRLGCGHVPDASNPDWKAYAQGLRECGDPLGWTLRFRAGRPDGGPRLDAREGCFGYAWDGRTRVRLHWLGQPGADCSPLGDEQEGERRAELRALLRHLAPEVEVAGASWLYHLARYRRLFPAAYLVTARPLPPPYQRLPLWGQFLDRRRQVRPQAVAAFLDALARTRRIEELGACFPLTVLAPAAPASVFQAVG